MGGNNRAEHPDLYGRYVLVYDTGQDTDSRGTHI